MISPIGSVTSYYPAIGSNAIGTPVTAVGKVRGIAQLTESNSPYAEKVKPQECQTCKNRKYVDQSNENVSYKAPTHISPQSSYSAVSAHEQEHVSNAVSEGSKEGNRLVSASVSLKMEICPECGKPYVAGGVTKTQIQYNTDNPYENSRKSAEASLLKGMNFDYVA